MHLKVFILLISLSLTGWCFAAGKLYRYEDESGVKVIRDNIPPDVIYKGYEILRSDGRLIKRVPPALTPEQLQELKAQKENRKEMQKEAAQQEAADRKLLTIFSAPKDAERARDRKIEALDVLISVNRGNIVRLQSEFDQAQQQAATRERTGKAVPEHLIEKMDRIDRQITKLKGTIAEKENEKQQVREQYARDIERLKFLMRQQGRLVE